MGRATWLVVVAVVFVFPTACFADSIPLGYISFDTLIPGGASPGVNNFNIFNFTNGLLASDFPVLNSIVFLNSSLTVISEGISSVYALGDIAPDFAGSSLSFSDTLLFDSASFTATLSNTVFNVAGGDTFSAGSSIQTATLLPSSGSFLAPGTDFALLTVSGTVSTPVPEPGTLWLFAIGLTCLAIIRTHCK